MKSYSIDLREKIVAAHLLDKMSIGRVAANFTVSKSLVQKLVKQQQIDGNLQPKQRGKPRFSYFKNAETELQQFAGSWGTVIFKSPIQKEVENLGSSLLSMLFSAESND